LGGARKGDSAVRGKNRKIDGGRGIGFCGAEEGLSVKGRRKGPEAGGP